MRRELPSRWQLWDCRYWCLADSGCGKPLTKDFPTAHSQSRCKALKSGTLWNCAPAFRLPQMLHPVLPAHQAYSVLADVERKSATMATSRLWANQARKPAASRPAIAMKWKSCGAHRSCRSKCHRRMSELRRLRWRSRAKGLLSLRPGKASTPAEGSDQQVPVERDKVSSQAGGIANL